MNRCDQIQNSEDTTGVDWMVIGNPGRKSWGGGPPAQLPQETCTSIPTVYAAL